MRLDIASGGRSFFDYTSPNVYRIEPQTGTGGFKSRPCSSIHGSTHPRVWTYSCLPAPPSPFAVFGQAFYYGSRRPRVASGPWMATANHRVNVADVTASWTRLRGFLADDFPDNVEL